MIGLEKVNGEHSLIMLVYNIKRTINILGVPDLIAKIKAWNSPYKRKDLFLIKTTYLNFFLAFVFFETPQNKFKIALFKIKLCQFGGMNCIQKRGFFTA
ncbi:hypothetical protein [Flavobacterium covae]|uniref:hypothetical protein n=1 Tax=Flavobacterium covae TaxID=2906076 RepID=UPI000745AEA2|nr:hypothetical protein [Flavobacterium covae]AMA49353.1 hypothetical protein AWN65_07735 [Flavobacterium covae]MCJ1810432.1 hypothetical protein [Flavobacterium covae]